MAEVVKCSANVYVFAEDQQLIACCSCPLTPNHLKTLSVQKDLISNTLTPGVPVGVTVSVLATTDWVAGRQCNPAKPIDNIVGTPGVANSFAGGLRGWGGTLHAAPAGGFAVTENPLSIASMSPSEFQKVTSYCGFIIANGSGFGICGSCRQGAAGGSKK